MDGQQFTGGLDFEGQTITHEQIQPISRVQFPAAIHNGKHDLPLDFVSALHEFEREAVLISTFQQPRPERGMNIECSIHDILRQVFISLFQRNPF